MAEERFQRSMEVRHQRYLARVAELRRRVVPEPAPENPNQRIYDIIRNQVFDYQSPEWSINAQDDRHKELLDKDHNMFCVFWPDFGAEDMNAISAGRVGFTVGRKWIYRIYEWHHDGLWTAAPSVVQADDWVRSRQIGIRDDTYPEVQRILSFWVTGGPSDMKRTFDPDGTNEKSEITLGLLIAWKSYEKRGSWSQDFLGKTVSRKEIGLEAPTYPKNMSAEDSVKTERFLNSLEDGMTQYAIPEVIVQGRRHERTHPPPPLRVMLDDIRELLKAKIVFPSQE